MLCGKPITLPLPYRDRTVPCGQCMACRINKQRKWTARILLEAARCAQSIFITLTYDDAHVPKANGQDVLEPRDLTLFLKRLRKSRMGHAHGSTEYSLRYFACGEYGTKTQRPHYHAILFGKHFNVQNETLIRETWGKGFITISELNEQRAAYTAQYAVKKWTQKDLPALQGRPPEFTRMSRNPGIGGLAIPYLAGMYHRNDGSAALALTGDIDTTVRINGKIWPLDHYMLTKMREYLDVPVLKADRLFVRYGRNPPQDPMPDYGKAAETLKRLEAKAKRPSHSTV